MASLTMLLNCSGSLVCSVFLLKVSICLTSSLPRSPASIILWEMVLLAALFERAVFCQFGKPYNSRENIIKIMSDAPRKRAEGLHLLGLAKLGLCPFLSRNVYVDLKHVEGFSVLVPAQDLAARHHNFRAVPFCLNEVLLPSDPCSSTTISWTRGYRETVSATIPGEPFLSPLSSSIRTFLRRPCSNT